MRIATFLDLVFRRGIEITHNYYSEPVRRVPGSVVSWQFIEEARKLTGEVDFGKMCQFDQKGLCSKYRKMSGRKRRCCCGQCGYTVGYFKQLPRRIEVITMLAKKFDSEKGFWRKGGCILPREFRSNTCLAFLCEETTFRGKGMLSEREILILDIVKNPFGYYKEYWAWRSGNYWKYDKRVLNISDFVEHKLNEAKKE